VISTPSTRSSSFSRSSASANARNDDRLNVRTLGQCPQILLAGGVKSQAILFHDVGGDSNKVRFRHEQSVPLAGVCALQIPRPAIAKLSTSFWCNGWFKLAPQVTRKCHQGQICLDFNIVYWGCFGFIFIRNRQSPVRIRDDPASSRLGFSAAFSAEDGLLSHGAAGRDLTQTGVNNGSS
jgi:hypothetical protein